jgi:hypothetical protein
MKSLQEIHVKSLAETIADLNQLFKEKENRPQLNCFR